MKKYQMILSETKTYDWHIRHLQQKLQQAELNDSLDDSPEKTNEDEQQNERIEVISIPDSEADIENQYQEKINQPLLCNFQIHDEDILQIHEHRIEFEEEFLIEFSFSPQSLVWVPFSHLIHSEKIKDYKNKYMDSDKNISLSTICIVCCYDMLDDTSMQPTHCSNNHMICHECFEHLVLSQDIQQQKVRENHCAISCPIPHCSHTFSTSTIFSILSSKSFQKYIDLIISLEVSLQQEQFQKDVQEKNQIQQTQDFNILFDSMIQEKVQEIIHTILETRCPCCDMLFSGFTGCFSLLCESESEHGQSIGCGTFFCGWCHEIFPNDKECHEHLLDRKCKMVPKAHKRTANQEGQLFGSDRDYEISCWMRRRKKFDDYLSNISGPFQEEIKIRLLAKCKDLFEGMVSTTYHQHRFA